MDKSGQMKNEIFDDNFQDKDNYTYQIENMLLKLASDITENKQPMRFTARSNVERILDAMNDPTKKNNTIIQKHHKLLKLCHSIGKGDKCNNRYKDNDIHNKTNQNNNLNITNSHKETLHDNQGITLPNIDRYELVKYINKDAKKIKASYHDKTYFKALQTIAGSLSSKNIQITNCNNNNDNKPIIFSKKDILAEIREYNEPFNSYKLTKHITNNKNSGNSVDIEHEYYQNNENSKKNKEIYRKTLMAQLGKIAFIDDAHSHEIKKNEIEYPFVSPALKIEDIANNILKQNNIYHQKIVLKSKNNINDDIKLSPLQFGTRNKKTVQ